MKVVKATGVFNGVRKARLAIRARANAAAGALELSLDSWESPLVFDVTAVERDVRGATVYRGTMPRAAGSQEVFAIVVEAHPGSSEDAVGSVSHIEVTRSTEGSAPDSVLDVAASNDP